MRARAKQRAEDQGHSIPDCAALSNTNEVVNRHDTIVSHSICNMELEWMS
jgi:hypothetical protein